MTTQAKITANRLNALRSTGPRTTEGKALAAKNSEKHGLTARQAVISSENRADFEQYRNQFLGELSPATPMESMLAERIVNLSWRLKRSGRIQNQTIDALSTPDTPNPLAKLTESILKGCQGQADPSNSTPDLPLGRLAIKDFSNNRVLERLLMYERRIEHSLYKTILEFQRLNLIKGLEC